MKPELNEPHFVNGLFLVGSTMPLIEKHASLVSVVVRLLTAWYARQVFLAYLLIDLRLFRKDCKVNELVHQQKQELVW